MHILTATRDDPRRPSIEAFIRKRYREAYDAEVENLPVQLIAATDNGSIACAAGLRTASDGFFCEMYFDPPAEHLIASKIGRTATRARLLEVTSLCSSSPLVSIDFLRTIALYGFEHGFEWSIFVATKRLSRLLKLLSFDPLELAPASVARVSKPLMWGSYYETSPVVMAVHRDSISNLSWAMRPPQSSTECDTRSCPLFGMVAELRARAAHEKSAA
jgi:hypothetical protein